MVYALYSGTRSTEREMKWFKQKALEGLKIQILLRVYSVPLHDVRRSGERGHQSRGTEKGDRHKNVCSYPTGGKWIFHVSGTAAKSITLIWNKKKVSKIAEELGSGADVVIVENFSPGH